MDIKALNQRKLGGKKSMKILVQIYSFVAVSHNISKRFYEKDT